MAYDATLLLTRPQAGSRRFAEQVRAALGPVDIVIAPMMEIEFQGLPPWVGAARTVLFTSINGVETWARSGLDCTAICFCVGAATAQAARDIGFAAHSSAGDLEHMVPDVIAAKPPEPVVHIHGHHTRGDLAGALRKAGYDAQGVVGYYQRLLPLPDEARELLMGDRAVIVPLFSPRSAAQFAKNCPKDAKPKVVAISRNAADHWAGAICARQPDVPSMIDAIKACFDAG